MSCANSRARLQRYTNFILSTGAIQTDQREEADLILVDTCAYTESVEKDSLNLIAHNERSAKAGAKVIACGCLWEINPAVLKEQGRTNFFSSKAELDTSDNFGLPPFPPSLGSEEVVGAFLGGYSLSQHSLGRRLVLGSWIRFLKAEEKFEAMRLPMVGKLIAATQQLNSKAYGISISEGCLGNCSFCVIPLSKGRTRSTAIGPIVQKIRASVENGVKRIVLTSEDIGAYGRDTGTSFIHLLEAIHKVPGDFTLHCFNFDPRWLSLYGSELIEIAAQGKIRSIDIPVQSGSNTVLKRMIRNYEIQPVMDILQKIKARCPQIALGTHLIAGFPGETEDEFQDSRTVVRSGLFDLVIIFLFSLRPGSQAETLKNHLSAGLIQRRARRLRWDWRLSLWGMT